MITPVVLGFRGVVPLYDDGERWYEMNVAAADWYARVIGRRPRVGQAYRFTTEEDPAGNSPHPPTHGQAIGIVQATFGPGGPFSILGIGTGASGAGSPEGCLIGDVTFRAWVDGVYPRTQLWLLLHEWGHVFGLAHPYGVWNRSDTIMGYTSTARFEAGEDVGFTEQELAILRASPLLENVEVKPVPEYPLMNICPWASWRPGPQNKVFGYDDNAMLAVCMHSMEGYEAGAWSQLDGENTGVSWHFSVMKSGTVYQHYPLQASPWHAGSKYQNQRLIGIEHEGVVGEPLTHAQRLASIDLVNWIAKQCGWEVSTTDGPNRRTVYFHSDATATSCPNGRINLADYWPAQQPPLPGFTPDVEKALNALDEAVRNIQAANDALTP